MTTASWSNSMAHTDDATFRAWGSQISSYLATVGFVQTADTGQINWTTATRPATNTYAGYEIWRFDDSLQGTAPIFFKLEYGTAASAAVPLMRMTVGTETDGAGTLSGVTASARAIGPSASIVAGSFNCYACHTEGVGFLIFRADEGAGWARFFFAIARTWDSAGAITNHGAVVMWHGTGTTSTTAAGAQALRFASPAQAYTFAGQTSGDASNFFNLPGTETDTSVGGDTQTTCAIGAFPEFKPVGGLGVAMLSELPLGSTATITYIGSTPHTYIQVGVGTGRTGARTNSSDDALLGLLCQWE